MLLLTLLACEPTPPWDSGATALDYPPAVSMSGDIVMATGVPEALETVDTGDGEVPLRIGHVFIYDAFDPPPPAGFGRPVDFTTISSGDWNDELGADGTIAAASAEWSITGVPDGTWLVTGLVDNDGDFSPFFDFAGGATCGDQTGAYVASSSSTGPLPLTVRGPDSIEGMTVLIGDPLPYERPAFQLDGAVVLDPTQALDPTDLSSIQSFNLLSHAITNPLLSTNATDAEECPTNFTMVVADADLDGVPDAHTNENLNGLTYLDGLPLVFDMYPKIAMVYVSDVNGNPADASYVSEAVVNRLALGWSLNPDDGSLLFPLNTPISATTLPLAFLPAALKTDADGSESVVTGDAVPRGVWALAVINHTGQTWILPNQLADESLFGAAADATQGAFVLLQ